MTDIQFPSVVPPTWHFQHHILYLKRLTIHMKYFLCSWVWKTTEGNLLWMLWLTETEDVPLNRMGLDLQQCHKTRQQILASRKLYCFTLVVEIKDANTLHTICIGHIGHCYVVTDRKTDCDMYIVQLQSEQRDWGSLAQVHLLPLPIVTCHQPCNLLLPFMKMLMVL